MTFRFWVVPLALLSVGCGDLLTETPDDFLAPENFYRTASDAEAAVISVYAPLTTNDLFKVHILRPLIASDDLGRVSPIEPQPRIRAFGDMGFTPDNEYLSAIWQGLFTTINRANVVTDRVPSIDMNQARQATMIGEAKFLRALAYFYLVRFWGDVPLITTEEAASADVSRSPADAVYQQILQDARDAAAVLPPTWGNGDAGRPTSGSANALLADVYLTLHEWQNAADAAKKVIDSGAHELYDDYLHAFLPAYENGSEHVFSLQFMSVGGPSSVLVRLLYPRVLGTNRGGGNATLLPTDAHYDSYLPGDYRHDVTFFTKGCNIQSQCRTFEPHIYKFRPTSPVPMNNGDSNWPIYRYSDVLLMYAEALNELGMTADAVVYLNMIRARARNADGTPRTEPADYSGAMSTEALRDAVYQERTWELAYEGKRWFDMKRRGEAYFLSALANDPEVTTLDASRMLWPIPETEIDLNSNLTQNPGY